MYRLGLLKLKLHKVGGVKHEGRLGDPCACTCAYTYTKPLVPTYIPRIIMNLVFRVEGLGSSWGSSSFERASCQPSTQSLPAQAVHALDDGSRRDGSHVACNILPMQGNINVEAEALAPTV